jgi:1-acyl-sn-glycerol-3-phosphate acyltransferase
MPSSQLDMLTQINLDDLVSSFGWQNNRMLARLLRTLFLKPARTFAVHMVEFDNAVGEHNLPDASRLTLQRYTQSLSVSGREFIPEGPFLALSNHPGMSDTLSLFAALDRSDLKIIALDRPFLNALPNTSRQLFYVRDDSASRVTLIRQVSVHLRNGGAALTFPAGHIEPDPEILPGALESLVSWTESVGVFLRMAPGTAVLPILVSGVIMGSAARHPLVNLKRTKEEKNKLTAALQLLGHVVFRQKDVHVRVQIGRPITVAELGTTDTQATHQAVLAGMRRLIENLRGEKGIRQE